jgi:hypothetical protein
MGKKLKIKLPKRVAGVKIPKAVRKGPIGQFLNSSAGQLVVAQALVAVAGAFAAKEMDEPPRDALRHPIESAKRGMRAVQPDRLSFALSAAARAFRDAMQSDGEYAHARAGAQDEPAPPAKKKSSTPADAPVPH